VTCIVDSAGSYITVVGQIGLATTIFKGSSVCKVDDCRVDDWSTTNDWSSTNDWSTTNDF
jgi:hypothetical protein